MLRNGLNLNNVSVFWQQILIGIVIILAVYIDVLRRRAAVAASRIGRRAVSGAGPHGNGDDEMKGGMQ